MSVSRNIFLQASGLRIALITERQDESGWEQPDLAAERPDHKIEIQLGSKTVILSSLEEFWDYVRHEGLNIDKLIGDEENLADFLSTFADAGLVLNDIHIGSYVEEKYGISVKDNMPRTERGHLVFMTVDPDPLNPMHHRFYNHAFNWESYQHRFIEEHPVKKP